MTKNINVKVSNTKKINTKLDQSKSVSIYRGTDETLDINTEVPTTTNIGVKVEKQKTILVNQREEIKRIVDLLDVNTTVLEDGSILIYDESQEKFVASRLLDKQNVNGGHF